MAAMEKVTGIGGFFFRSKDRDALNRWYEQHLGVTGESWSQQAGPTAWAAFPQDTAMFGRPEQQWMINFRVDDLAAMVAQLRAAGIAVEADPETYPFGLFAQLADPEGNPIQLWEPR